VEISFSSKNDWFSGSETGIFLKKTVEKIKKIQAAKNADSLADLKILQLGSDSSQLVMLVVHFLFDGTKPYANCP
jgi:hypothetical protein